MPVDSPCQDFKTDVNLATLPCGGCPYCARAQAQLSKFMTDVDDVVPLASKGKGVESGSVNEILVAGQGSAEGGFLDEILVAGQNPAVEGICISRVTVATVGRDVVIVPDNPDCSIQVVQDGLWVVLGKYTVEQICDAQSKDPEFKWLTDWLDDNSCQPAQGDLFRSSPPAKFYWTIKERFSRDERGMIMYHAKDGEGNSEGTMAGAWEFLHRKLKSGRTRTIYAQVVRPRKSKPEPLQASTNPTGLRRSARRKGRIRDVQRRECWRQPKEELGCRGEEGREERELSPRGRHRDRVPSGERDTPSLRDTKGQEGEAEVQGEAISGDHRNPSQKAGDTSLGGDSRAVSRSTRDGSPNSRKGLVRQKERLAEEAARLRRALRDAQERQTPQSGSRGRAGVSAQNIFQQGGGRRETGVSGQRTPQRSYTAKGTGMSEQRTPRGNFTARETGLSSQRTPQHDYTLRETGVSGQRTPQYDNTPRERDLPTLQKCPVRALEIQPHVMLEHVAEVFGEPTGSPRASLVPIRVAALQAQAWMLVGGDLEDLVAHINLLAITRPHIIGQAVQGQMEEVYLEGGRPVPPYFSTAPVNSPGALIDWRVQAAIMGELGDKAEAFRGCSGCRDPGQPQADSHFHLDRGWRQWRMAGRMDRRRFIEMRLPTPPETQLT
ncbi:unnamed protein product [Mytilus coruscus]|uniref:Uncharacterized protein n=1 Tax=Mytilus coruscus TaxID=42192 RepID=A0A6J8ALD5_MYTCO|nr:unnamed protein product [Mytilus coruscus]